MQRCARRRGSSRSGPEAGSTNSFSQQIGAALTVKAAPLSFGQNNWSNQMLERYNPILNAIRELCPTAHIGGGAVRDSLLERPIKDIDLFLDDVATNDAAELMRSQFSFVKVGEWTAYERFSDP